jgi:hypothetical protein
LERTNNQRRTRVCGPIGPEAAAEVCGFTIPSFYAWVKAGLLPSSLINGWTPDQLEAVLHDLAQYGVSTDIQQNSTARRSLPGVMRIRRRLVDGNHHEHLRHRKTGRKLPGPLGSPQCMSALIECEREVACQHVDPQSNGTSNSAGLTIVSAAQSLIGEARQTLDTTDDATAESAKAPRYLTPEEVSQRWRGKITPETLANWRAMQIGPAYTKIGKAVLYPSDLLERWEEERLVACDLQKMLMARRKHQAA